MLDLKSKKNKGSLDLLLDDLMRWFFLMANLISHYLPFLRDLSFQMPQILIGMEDSLDILADIVWTNILDINSSGPIIASNP